LFHRKRIFSCWNIHSNSIAKLEQLSTAAYKRASSPSFLQAHIQLADNDIPSKPSLIGAQTMFDSASAIAVLLPATGSIMLQLENVPSK
jgi:hypothetical protein